MIAPGTAVDAAGRYRLTSRIATGGMGEVWRAEDKVLGRQVAVKLLKHEYADDPTFRSRFEAEARHTASLHHPGVAGVFDFGEAPTADGSGVPRPYLVMELVDGQPLSALLRSGQPLDPDAAAPLLAQAAEALGAAHLEGIVHRDVKPANLLVTPDRRIKVTDFGIARATEGMTLTQSGQVMGTPAYISPEQAQGERAGPASDVYSLGVVAYECLAGRRPFTGESPVATALAHVRRPPPPLPDEVPAPLAAVVMRALSKDPEQRYADGRAFAAALRDPDSTAAGAAGGAAGAVAGGAAAGAAGGAAAPKPPPSTPTTRVLTPAGGAAAPAAPAAKVSDTSSGSPRRTGAPWWLILLLVVAVVGLLILLASSLGGDPEQAADRTADPTTSAPTAEESSPPPEEPATVVIAEGDYLGDDVDDAAEELRELDLRVTLQEVENTGEAEENTVEGVSPTGTLQVGDTVTVSYWGPAAEEPEETPSPTESGPKDPGSEGKGPKDEKTPKGPQGDKAAKEVP